MLDLFQSFIDAMYQQGVNRPARLAVDAPVGPPRRGQQVHLGTVQFGGDRHQFARVREDW